MASPSRFVSATARGQRAGGTVSPDLAATEAERRKQALAGNYVNPNANKTGYGEGVDPILENNPVYQSNAIKVDPATGRIISSGPQGHVQRNGDGKIITSSALLGGGGISKTPYGANVDPNQLPFFDPMNPKVSPAAAYLNLLTRPSDSTAGTRSAIGAALFPALQDSATPRGLPGSGAELDARRRQMGAAQGVAGSGQAARNEQGAVMRGGRTVGAREDAGQAALDAALFNQAMGRGGPTAAQSMFGSALNQNIRAQRALAQGVRGGSAAAAMRQGTQAGVQLGLEAQNQAAALRAQEQQAAQGLLSQNLATGRGQDLQTLGLRGDLASTTARDALARDLAAAGVLSDVRGQDQGAMALGLEGRGLDDQRQLQLLSQALGLGDLELRGGAADATTLLNAFNALGGHLLERQSIDLGKPTKFQSTIKDINAGMDVVGKGAATVGSLYGA